MEHGEICQYRNPDLWEQYSEVALQRLLNRMNNEKDKIDYWCKTKTLTYNEYTYLENSCIELHIKSFLDIYDKRCNIKNPIAYYLQKLDLDAIQKKLYLQIFGREQTIYIISKYEKILNQYAAIIMCDIWDCLGEFEVCGSEEACRRLKYYLERRENESIAFDYDAYSELLPYLDMCGYRSAGNGILPQMYRLDTIFSSDILHSLYSMKLSLDKKEISITPQKAGRYAWMDKIQQMMYVNGFSWTDLNLSYEMSIQKINSIIQKYEKEQKCYKHPHRSFCFSDMTLNADKRIMFCWSCGNSKIINSLANEIKDNIERVLGVMLEWPLCGTELAGKIEAEEKAHIWLCGLDEVLWIVIGEVSL